MNKSTLITEIHSHINQLVQENKELIFERWSYSSQMDDMIDYVYTQLSNDLPNSKTRKIDNGIWLKTNVIDNLSIFWVNDITFEYYVYVCENDEMCEYVINNCYSMNNFNEMNNELAVTFYTVNYQIIEEPSNKNLSHELEHILQVSQGRKNNINYSSLMDDAYNLASQIISDETNINIYDETIAWLIYYSNPHEQDSFMNEYYQDLRCHRQFLNSKDSETHLRYYDYVDKYNFFIKNMTKTDLLTAVIKYKLYGYTISNINLMCQKGVKRFKKKMNNIEKHFNTVINRANEQKIRLKPITNGSIIFL